MTNQKKSTAKVKTIPQADVSKKAKKVEIKPKETKGGKKNKNTTPNKENTLNFDTIKKTQKAKKSTSPHKDNGEKDKKTKKKTVNKKTNNDNILNNEKNIRTKTNKKLLLCCFIFIICFLLFIAKSLFITYKTQEEDCKNPIRFVNSHIDCRFYDYISEIGYKFKIKALQPPLVDKPLIYLYPEEETEIAVKLGNPQKISHSYPKYENKWVVTAKPNGDLTYNNRYYYGLYWEGKNAPKIKLDEGFVVKGSDSITFLEEKLAILGLNEREANEFIIYWLPKLENNPYNFIKFASMEVQNKYMPLNIEPKPDTLIRVMMAYKGLDNPIKIKEQILEPSPKRNGFVVIEWGGTEINSDKVY